MTEPSIDVDREQSNIEQRGRRAFGDVIRERNLLLDAVRAAVGDVTEEFCEDNGIDVSLGVPNKLEVLKFALHRIHEMRSATFPEQKPEPLAQTLPVSDIPLVLADP